MSALEKFEGVFPTLVDELVRQCSGQDELSAQAGQWFKKSLTYNVVGGKCNRGLSVIDTTRHLLGRDLNEDEYFHAATLGWTVELLQAMMLVLDDMMDASTTRRGRPCWYKSPDVGMIAVNDAPMLESAIYMLLRAYFRDHPAYVDLVETLHKETFRVELGQTYDMIVELQGFKSFGARTYERIVTHKTAYYSFYLPVALALLYTGRASPGNLKQAEAILVPMGTYFQVQDDYLDNFADPRVLGKVGTDILDGKCSWLVVQALERCAADAEATRVLKDNYGKKDAGCEQAVKALYAALALQDVYAEYEAAQVAALRQMIEAVDETDGLKKTVFTVFLDKIYNRAK